MDSPPEFCFCGRKTVEYHDFLFCSTQCARQDALRSLGGSECHYRTVVRDAYVRAGASELQPRRMASAVHICPTPSDRLCFVNVPPPFMPPPNLPQQSNMTPAGRVAWDENMGGFPTRSGNALSTKSTAGEPVAESHNRSRREGFPHAPSRAHPILRPDNHTFQQINLNSIPLPEEVPIRPLRRAPSSIDVLNNNTKKSTLSMLLNLGRSRKGKEVGNPERISGHSVNAIAPPGRKEARRGRIL